MKIFQCEKIKELDQYTIEHEPITSIDLMERTAKVLTAAIMRRWKPETPIVVFAGPGNNGGDALAVARLLATNEYKVETYLLNTKGTLSEECQQNKDKLSQMENTTFVEINKRFALPQLSVDHLVIDGLFGTGLNKPLAGGFSEVVKFINTSGATIVSIDIPSGLNGDGNHFDIYPNIIIKANLTLTIQLPKIAFFFPENDQYIGEWEILNIGLSVQGMNSVPSKFSLMEEDDLKELIKPRPTFAHKGTFGHALLIAGSYGMAGASILAAKACIHSGVGMLTIHAPSANLPILQMTVPEAIVEPDVNESAFSTPNYSESYQAIGIGPGIGTLEETENAFLGQVRGCQIPMVLDADALNLLASNKEMLKAIPKNSILTPHPKEFERLAGECSDSYERLQKAIQLSAFTKSYIILKGAYSIIISPNGNCAFNPTGNPGMATAGSGDVLTGIILALLAQGYESNEAAMLGTYVHGLAGDIAAQEKGMISITASDIIDALPAAWKKMEKE